MQVGDLVTWKSYDEGVGLIVEIGKYAGNGDVKVLWNRGIDSHEPCVHNSKFLKALTSS